MKFIADFHIHSHYSRATSKLLTPEHLDYFGRIKGVQVIGTGDFTHPGWFGELQEKMEPAEQGLFRLKKEYSICPDVYQSVEQRFILSAEISNIYKKNGKTRKVHNVIVAPDFETVGRINQKLEGLGANLTSDGRPIMGLDSHDLLEIALEANENIFFIPAHIWTPWFSALGAKSGFDSIYECYEDLTKHIYAVETGLSTDPAMNWMVSSLDQFTLLSNSDAHSPDKIGRNANWFNTNLSYNAIFEAVKNQKTDDFIGTIDMYPQAGKYHYDGHRKCNVCLDPVQAIEKGGKCPVCGKNLTEGVMNRVSQLSDRKSLTDRKFRKEYFSIVPLREILAEIEGVGPASKKVGSKYEQIIDHLGSEMSILLEMPVEKIKQEGYNVLSEAIKRMRNRQVYIQEGYDGEYGKITVFKPGESSELRAGESLFNDSLQATKAPESRPLLNFDLPMLQNYHKSMQLTGQQIETVTEKEKFLVDKKFKTGSLGNLNIQQEQAVTHAKGPAIVLAGPGTGKTKTLTSHIFYLINQKQVDAADIAAITFTNKAAKELQTRVSQLLNIPLNKLGTFIGTFHSLGHHIISKHINETNRKTGFNLIDQNESIEILKQEFELKITQAKKIQKKISEHKQLIIGQIDADTQQIFCKYEQFLIDHNLFDLDDLLYVPVQLIKQSAEVKKHWQNKYAHLLVDEYQDTNPVQYELLRLLIPGKNDNIYAVGDPNQAIYGFRGASVKYIRRFLADFPEANLYRLKQSYRCSNNILGSSAGVLTTENSMISGLKDGIKVKINKYATGAAEAEGIARIIESITGGVGFFSVDSDVVNPQETETELSLADIAILLRTRRQTDDFREALGNHQIPFQETNELPFWKQKPWSLIIDLLEITVNPAKSLLWKNLEAYAEIIKEAPQSSNSAELITFFCKRLAEKYTFPEIQMQRLIEISENIDIHNFLYKLKTGWGNDALDQNLEAVQLLTMHASKGLEFDTVFIPGLEEGLLPNNLFNPETDIEEEQRLMYVAMTRAKNSLILSHAQSRYLFNRQQKLKPSQFLKRIDKEFAELKQIKQKRAGQPGNQQLRLF